MYAQVIVDVTHEKLDRVFSYRVPEGSEADYRIGSQVYVPFGKGNRQTKAFIVAFCETVDYDETKVKELSGVVKDGVAVESRLIELAAWIKEHYGGTMSQALRTVLPIRKKERIRQKRTVVLNLPSEEAKEQLAVYRRKNQKARARVLEGLLLEPEQAYEWMTKKLGVTLAVLRAMEEQGVLRIEAEQTFRNPVKESGREKKPVVLNEEQRAAVRTVTEDLTVGRRKTYLLHGVTGSGKTEVYIAMIQAVVSKGKQAIVLIPEIALTYQTVLRFYGAFGERVSILHSKMSAGERSDQMQRVQEGKIDVMIGPRSALFTPFSDLGLIVIDEEHETTYKSEQVPRYHAREVAVARAQIEGASVVLGSATPSMESYYRCQRGDYTLLRLPSRVSEKPLAKVYVEDMREELKKGNRSILSDRLRALIQDRLLKKQQVILFLNRRGYAGFLSCRTCGEVIKCPHCDVSLSAHTGGKLICHYCGYEQPEVTVCPTCGSSYIGRFKAGTQQVEALLVKTFPGARVLRMDADTTGKKDGHEKILSAFLNEEADILIGTQMIVKGHDFPKVTLVGVLAADMSLYASEYCSGERTFQLLTQAAGRAGRGDLPGEVVIQTYSPEHYSIVYASAQDYEGFYEEELKFRSDLGYPPTGELLAIRMDGEEEALLEKAANYLKEFALRVDRRKELRIIGPATPHVGKVKDTYRRVIYIKSEEEQTLIEVKDQLERYIEINAGFRSLRIQFDFQPMNFY